MFSTSADILNFVLATSIVTLTVFLCVALFYIISSFRKTQKIIRAAENIITKTDDLLSLVKDKVKNSGTYIMLLGEVLKKGLDIFSSKKKEDKEDKKRSEKTDEKKLKKTRKTKKKK